MKKNNVILIIVGLLLLCLIVVGSTFAFFSASVRNNNSISGNTYTFDANLTISTIKAGELVPTVDSLINTSLNGNNACISSDDYSLCNIYKITLTNGGEASSFTGDIKTISGTTYVTNHVKYQLFELNSGTYTSVSDMKNLEYANNSVSDFTLNSNTINVSLSTNQTKEYYLVVWLSDVGVNQLEDADKKYVGTVEFSLASGKLLTANFTA